MCLSTVYKNEIKEENIIMKNVMSVEFINGKIILKDLMEREKEVDGELLKANLVDGFVLLKTK